MSVKRLLFLSSLIMLLVLLVSFENGSANNRRILSVTPNEAAAHGEVYVRGRGFSPATVYRAVLERGGVAEVMGELRSTSSGEVRGTLTIPDVVPNRYNFQLVDGVVVAAETPLIVISSPEITLTPTNGPPGTEVTVTVTGLQVGMLQINYDGGAVLGPIPVDAEHYTGRFVVPRDRPVNLGSGVTVEAINRNGRVTMATVSTTFNSEAESPRIQYAFNNVQLPESQVRPGELFPINGRIDPPPTGDLGNYAVTAVWRTAEGVVVPITASETQLQTNGEFEVMATVPSFLAGDALSIQSGELGLFVSELNQRTSVETEVTVIHESQYVDSSTFFEPPENKIDITFLVTDPDDNPIEEALVYLELASGLNVLEEEPEMMWQNASIGDVIFNAEPNQVNYVYQEAAKPSGPNDSLYEAIENYNPLETCGISALRGFTDEEGRFELTLEREYIYFLINGTHIDATAGGQVYIDSVDLGELLVTAYVNAAHKGFAPIENGEPVATKLVMKLIEDDVFLEYDPESEEVVGYFGQNPTLQFAIPPMGDLPYEIPGTISSIGLNGTDVSLGSGNTDVNLPNIDGYFFDSFVTFPNGNGNNFDPYFAHTPTPLLLLFNYNAAVYGLVDEVRVYLDDKEVGTVESGEDCGTDITFSKFLDVGRLSTGFHSGRIELDQGPSTTVHRFSFETLAPPTWFLDDSLYQNQTISYSPGKIVISVDDVPRETAVNASNVEYMGDIDNNTESSGGTVQKIYATGNANFVKTSASDSLVVNNDTAPTSQEIGGSAVVGGNSQYVSRWSPLSPSTSGSFGPVTTEILDTGIIPIFRYGWGIWPLAEATVGADMWFRAEITNEGVIEFDPAPLTTVTMTPAVEAGIKLFLDVSVLFDVFEARLEALPSIRVETPVSIQNNQEVSVDGCFKFVLQALYYAKVGWCPFCFEANEVVELAEAQEGVCSQSDFERLLNATQMRPTAVQTSPPSLATDGYGNTSLVYVDETGTLKWYPQITKSDDPPQEVTNIPGVGAPVMAYYDQGKAVQLMTALDIPLTQISQTPFQEGLNKQYIAYRLTDDETETATDVQPLTAVSTTQGGVRVAGCMAGNPGCPEAGEVTAVWMRDMAGQLEEREFRLFYATFRDGAWTTPQPVDPTSSATDSQATVTYVDGVPVVAWVRNQTRSLAQLGERQFAYRFLDGSSPVVTPPVFPKGIASPSMVADSQGNLKVAFTVAENPEESFIGNQRTLHTAVGTCVDSTCTWEVQKVRDGRGRDVRAERPHMLIEADDTAVVTMRVIGLGEPTDNNPRYIAEIDPEGVYQGTGEAAHLEAKFADVAHHLIYLSNEVDIEWNPTAVYDPASDVILTTHVTVNPNPVIFQPDERVANAVSSPVAPHRRMVDADDGVVMTTLPRLPEFAITAVVPETPYPQSGESFDVTVQLNNAGVGWVAGEGERLAIVATWDGPYGLGDVAKVVSVSEIESGASISVTLPISASVDMDGEHHLYVTVNPIQSITEANGSNNVQQITVGGVPGPSAIVVDGERGESLVFLNWEAVDDPRIVGYRIYRAAGNDDPLIPLGSSLTHGYVDLKAFLDVDYRYAVTAYTASGAESAFSEEVFVSLRRVPDQQPMIYLPLVTR